MNKEINNKLKSVAKNNNNKKLSPELLLAGNKNQKKIGNAPTNKISTDIKLIKAQISTLTQLERFIDALIIKLACLTMKMAVPLTKNIILPLGLPAAASAADAGIQRMIHGQWPGLLFGISNKDMDKYKLWND